MDRYTKIIDGKTIIKKRSQIVVYHDDLQTINPSHDLLIADGWTLYQPPVVEYTEEQLLAQAKAAKIRDIEDFDVSPEVNIFRLNGMDIWLDKATRTGLMLRLQAEKASFKDLTTLWYEGMAVTLPTDAAMSILYALEVYASECYDRTQYHKAEVDKMESIEAVEAYDYEQGYPQVLEFDL